MAKMICMTCDLEFPSDEVYLAHKQGGHQNRAQGVPLVNTGMQPDPDFVATVERIEAQKKREANPLPKPEEMKDNPANDKEKEAAPIELTYKYTGDCPSCKNPITTLELDVPMTKDNIKHFVVAHCVGCNKQLVSREEKRL